MKRYPYYTLNFQAKQGEIVNKEFFRKRLEIGGIDWYNRISITESGKLIITPNWRDVP